MQGEIAARRRFLTSVWEIGKKRWVAQWSETLEMQAAPKRYHTVTVGNGEDTRLSNVVAKEAPTYRELSESIHVSLRISTHVIKTVNISVDL